jgi:hypothetical protein
LAIINKSHGGNRFAVGSMRIKLAYEHNFPPAVSIEWWRLPMLLRMQQG